MISLKSPKLDNFQLLLVCFEHFSPSSDSEREREREREREKERGRSPSVRM